MVDLRFAELVDSSKVNITNNQPKEFAVLTKFAMQLIEELFKDEDSC